MTPAFVIDVSNNNAEPDWTTVRAHGIAAVYLKAGEGLHFVDPFFARWRKAAHGAGLHVGAYHFAHPTEDAAVQAHHFAETIGEFGRGDLLPALDLEIGDPAHAERWARTFSQSVHRALGHFPVFYSYSGYIDGMNLTRPIGAGLWLANYSRDDGTEHPFTTPAPWKRTLLHQFSSKARVVGCRGLVDLSHAPNLKPLVVK